MTSGRLISSFTSRRRGRGRHSARLYSALPWQRQHEPFTTPIEVCDLLNANFQVYLTSIKALYISRQRLAWQELLPSSAYHAVGSQADNFFHLVPRHTHSTIPSRLPTHTIERERGSPMKQAMPERGFVSPPGHHRSPSSTASRRTDSSLLS